MRAARRWCLRAAVLAGMLSVSVSVLLSACQFPSYMVSPTGGSGGSSSNAGSGGAGLSDAGGKAGDGNGAAGDGGAEQGGDGGAAGAPQEPCAPESCAARAPTGGWEGPIAFWEGPAGSTKVPDCPPGYTDGKELHRGLVAPPSSCACTCASQGQSCDANTTLTIYTDLSCSSSCQSVPLSDCTTISNCNGSQGSMRAEIPTPAGGACVPSVKQPEPPAWQFDAKVCTASDVQVCPGDQICAPTPMAPFEPIACVKRTFDEGASLPGCPAGFPQARPLLYADFDDDRGCSECRCSSLNGGSCTGTLSVSLNTTCTTTNPVDYELGSGCKTFNLGQGDPRPRSVIGDYELTPGTCSVATASKPTGGAAESGKVTLVCCKE